MRCALCVDLVSQAGIRSAAARIGVGALPGFSAHNTCCLSSSSAECLEYRAHVGKHTKRRYVGILLDGGPILSRYWLYQSALNSSSTDPCLAP